MAINEFSDVAPALSESDMRAVEREIGYQLPAELRQHYLRINGGAPERRYFLTKDGMELEINEFRPIAHRARPKQITIESTILDLVKTRRLIPEALVPFAVNSGGDFYCVDRRDQSIVYYTMDDCLNPGVATNRAADSLAEFIDGMVTEQEAFR